jgi:hypothetical protein
MEYIHEERNVIPKTFCTELIEKFESDSRKREGKTKRGAIEHRVKKCTDLNIALYADWELERNRIDKVFRTAFRNYQNNLKLNVFGEEKAYIVDQLFLGKNIRRSDFQIGRYGVGGYFKWHVDYVHCEDRMCNFIVYLNDHEACTEFLNGKKIKPEAGKIIFFPTTWVHAHCGQTIEKGNKYIITGFIFYKKELTQSLPFTITYD